MESLTLDIVAFILKESHFKNKRTGQIMMHLFPQEAQERIVGTSFDPFYEDMDVETMVKWFDNHVIFDKRKIIGLFDHDRILWEDDSPDMGVAAIVRVS